MVNQNDDFIQRKIDIVVADIASSSGKSKEDVIKIIISHLSKMKIDVRPDHGTTSSRGTLYKPVSSNLKKSIKTKGDIKLHFINGSFEQSPKSTSKSQATVLINIGTSTVTLSFFPETGLIARRTASRQAESIAKSGFVLNNNERVAVGFTFEIIDESKLSEAHLRVGHEYNKM